jgi:hypothetical protein
MPLSNGYNTSHLYLEKRNIIQTWEPWMQSCIRWCYQFVFNQTKIYTNTLPLLCPLITMHNEKGKTSHEIIDFTKKRMKIVSMP